MRWIDESLRRDLSPLLTTQPTAAVRLAEAAEREGMRLDGLSLALFSEPLTPGRARMLLDSGARISLAYSGHETGSIAMGCLEPAQPDEGNNMVDTLGIVG
ncbi:MAG: hypothetical protein A3F84_25895 [Candidatus Handelsmanbacteria bacterium RIFCSPLOWO2_12_FULL_64_10]|uniref:Uncharacterized protein n=1 Tax=Handelsmanbacteria sp. (strain RIFCSPLOWO2_12_FULL_64_10) TaxID=1817868 RepID=A0A1F6CSI4_HANXR|nr:MAG: hypothetical protein A3F84_25895 [Candidatus Handelsmanbacteria bacterium RIFCSPLOWO2_12_FULL_64_10]